MPNGQVISPILTDNDSVQDLGAGGVLNQLPSLKQTAETIRTQNLVFNYYKDSNGNRYDSTHPNSQSDGDDRGRGEVSAGQGVGTRIDQHKKNTLLYTSGNKFKPGNGYYGINYSEEYW
jgi:hypothetical protein